MVAACLPEEVEAALQQHGQHGHVPHISSVPLLRKWALLAFPSTIKQKQKAWLLTLSAGLRSDPNSMPCYAMPSEGTARAVK